MQTELASAIAQWDGKATDIGHAIYEKYQTTGNFLEQLIELLNDQTLQDGASWLLKHSLERSEKLSSVQMANVCQQFPYLVNWPAKLHILQILDLFSFDDDCQILLEVFVRKCLCDDNKFVRAWAYHGFYLLAKRFPAYQKEAEQFFKLAMQDEPASVKARVRHVLKLGF